MAMGEVHSIRHNKGIVALSQTQKQGSPRRQASSPPSILRGRLRKFLLGDRSFRLLLRDRDGRDVAIFKCTRIEEGRRADSPLLLHGYFQPRLSQPKLFVGFQAGMYEQEAGYLPPKEIRHQKLSPYGNRKSVIRHPKDHKEMLLVQGDVVVYGQSFDASLDNFNPYFKDRNPKHLIRLDSFYMDKYEVTNAEYFHFCRATAYPLPYAWRDKGSFPEGRGNHPFHKASYKEARAYAAWANKRLPTEQEWEMAARGGLSLWMNGKRNSLYKSPPIYPTGNRFQPHLCNTLETGIKDTQAVYDLRDKSPYGIFGLCGNAREWTSSWYAPYRGHYWTKKMKGGRLFKVIRGGSFAESRKAARSDYRDHGGLPSLDRDHSAGFRLVVSLNR